VSAGETQLVGVIPANRDKVFVQLAANADVDLRLTASDGTILLKYTGAQPTGWTGGCVNCEYATIFTYNSMAFTTCVDKCSEDMILTVR